MDAIKNYWDEKFKSKKKIWGDEPSEAAQKSINFLKNELSMKSSLLDLACGYGRDSILFSQYISNVTGIDISSEAIDMAKKYNKEIDFVVGDMFDLPFNKESFDIVFGNFILHLFLKKQRNEILKEIFDLIKPGGVCIISVASIDDSDFGLGDKIEDNCYINSRGVTKCYYSIEMIEKEFTNFSDIKIEVLEEEHSHDFPHIHRSYLIFAKREGKFH